MIQLHQFIFNDFSENTYVLWDETLECVIIDPGCYNANEREDLKKFIEGKKLHPVLLLNTHCHLDHVFGNKWVKENFNVPFYAHQADLFLLNAAVATGNMYGLFVEPSPQPDRFIREGETISFGNSVLKILEAPGHSPGSVCFYGEKEKLLISGDVLFQGSIGRFDLPGGDYETLMQSIFSKLLILPEDVKVYSGHGPVTSIGTERGANPFVLEYKSEMKMR
jgi:hydroxyacylglutathione hydrolase